MIDYQRLFHTGIRVPDLDRAMAEMGGPLGVTWASVQHNPTQAVWTPERGLDHVPLSFVYSCEGPQHVELLEGPAGTIWDGATDPGVHHVGLDASAAHGADELARGLHQQAHRLLARRAPAGADDRGEGRRLAQRA